MDAEKLQKLAAGRKKLKNYQKEKNSKGAKKNDDDSTTPADSPQTVQNHALQLQTYFSDVPPAANFFDNVLPLDHSVSYEDPEINLDVIYDLHNQAPLSAKENLRQISSQMSKLLEPNYENHDNFSDLEKRNMELASLYDAEKLKSNQLELEVQDYKNRVKELEVEMLEMKREWDNRLSSELGPLQEQLQCHMQTVGIFMGEKTELTAALNQSQILVKQKSGECDELQARLKTSRSRVADLERELVTIKEAKMKFEQSDLKCQQEFDGLKNDLEMAQQDGNEAREKLRILTEENTCLQQKINEINTQLGLANVKIQQLTAGELSKDDSRLENFVHEKLQMEKQIADLQLAVKNAVSERDLASNQYQQYVQQLNLSVSNLAQKLEITVMENESLKKMEQDLIKHVGELEKRLQSLQNEHINFVPKTQGSKEVENLLREELEEKQKQYGVLQEKFQDLLTERDELLKDIDIRKEAKIELENKIEELKSAQVDGTQLLATIESEKVAASRAVQQNSELKKQLEEMQEAYIRMTNDKAELIDKLTTEQYKQKDYDERIHTLEHQLHTLSDAIQIKDQELMEMRENSSNLNKQVVLQSQLTDRLRHYEAHENSSQALTNELQDALRQIEALKMENKQLQENHEHNHDENDHHCNGDHQQNEEYDMNEANLQTEIFELKQRIDSLTIERDNLKAKLAPEDLSTNNNHDINKELAMRQLEAKFMRTMQDIANLQDEKQMLEHLVLQLQGETETIGEYIALYQHQRGVLKQRAHEKEVQLKQLAKDRELMKGQLIQLNELIARLVAEKGISPEVLKQQEALNKQTNELCAEHAKMHKEMQELTDIPSQEITAKKIIELLTEIKSSNLVQPADVTETFHPCPWCSGQLITV